MKKINRTRTKLQSEQNHASPISNFSKAKPAPEENPIKLSPAQASFKAALLERLPQKAKEPELAEAIDKIIRALPQGFLGLSEVNLFAPLLNLILAASNPKQCVTIFENIAKTASDPTRSPYKHVPQIQSQVPVAFIM